MSYELERSSSGCLRVKGYGVRVFVAPVSMISKMREELRKVLGPAADVMLREIGKSYAQSMLEIVKGESGNSGEMITEFLKKAGFGEVEVKKEGDKYVFEIRRSPSCELGLERCRFEEGVVLGLIEGLEGGRWRVRTVEFNDEKCKIEAQRT